MSNRSPSPKRSTVFDPVFGCVLWTGRKSHNGYGVLDGRRAHRALYEQERGEIGEDLVLDHLCRRPACVALHHLEPVSKDENERRKSWAYRVSIKTCPRGHSLALMAIVTPEGGRVCRMCRDEFRAQEGL